MNLNKIYLLIFLLIISCKTNNNIDGQDFISLEKVSNKQVESLFEYVYPVNRKFFTRINDKIKMDSFRPIIFSYVKPLVESKNYPQRIFGVHNRIEESSVKYFQNDLYGKNISYLKKDNKIVFRYYYQDYKYMNAKQSTKSPKNKEDVLKFLQKNKNKV